MSFHWPNSPEPTRSPRPIGSIVWHFTGPDGLLGILSSNRFWASDPIALNDQRELKYGLGVMVGEWTEMRGAAATPPELVDFVDDLLSDDWQASLLESVFIVSASTSPEIAAQWLNYANGSGFAIGFEREHLWWPIPSSLETFQAATTPPEVPPIWLAVDYDPAEQRRTARDLLGSALEIARQEATPWTRDLLRLQVAAGVATFKHHAFSAEQEVRLAVPRVGQSVQFRSSGGRLIPYTEVACYQPEPETNQGRARGLPISEIVCAPGSSDATIATVRRLLNEKGYRDVQVKRSSLPLS